MRTVENKRFLQKSITQKIFSSSEQNYFFAHFFSFEKFKIWKTFNLLNGLELSTLDLVFVGNRCYSIFIFGSSKINTSEMIHKNFHDFATHFVFYH